jgi:integrase
LRVSRRSDTLARYLTQLVENGKKLSTIRRARIAIGLAHAERALPRPDHDPCIRLLERGMARTHGTAVDHVASLLLEQVTVIVGALDAGARADRDRAVLLLGFWGAFRSSELAAITIEDVAFTADAMPVHLPFSKRDPLGRGDDVDLAMTAAAALCPVRATRRWLERVGCSSGPLFRPVRGERIASVGIRPLLSRGLWSASRNSPPSAAATLRTRCAPASPPVRSRAAEASAKSKHTAAGRIDARSIATSI